MKILLRKRLYHWCDPPTQAPSTNFRITALVVHSDWHASTLLQIERSVPLMVKANGLFDMPYNGVWSGELQKQMLAKYLKRLRLIQRISGMLQRINRPKEDQLLHVNTESEMIVQ